MHKAQNRPLLYILFNISILIYGPLFKKGRSDFEKIDFRRLWEIYDVIP